MSLTRVARVSRQWRSTKYGGYMKDIPLPHKRAFKGAAGEEREIKVTISRFYGIGCHYYVSAQEENNPILLDDSTEQLAWDDEDGKGQTWSLGRFAKYKTARRVADRFIDRWSKKPGYAIELDDCEDSLSEQDWITPEWD